jgi:DNA-binding IclR family transcriptional regulator
MNPELARGPRMSRQVRRCFKRCGREKPHCGQVRIAASPHAPVCANAHGMKVSVSRSVGRAFAVMEAFRTTRRPATATDLSRKLGFPHSSTVAVLYNLCELGYLSHDPEKLLFFPTTKLLDLAAWMRPAAREHGKLAWLVDTIVRDTGHTTVLSSRLSLFVNTVMTRTGKYQVASGAAKSVGAALACSVPGRAILAQMPDDDVRGILRDTSAWQKEAGLRQHMDAGRTLASIDTIRRRGFSAGMHPACEGTEIIAYAIPTAGVPMALAVHLPARLSHASKDDVHHAMEFRLRACAEAPRTLAAA